MLAKAKTQVLKLSPIFSCIRQANKKIEDDDNSAFDFVVTSPDVKAAWIVVELSMNTFCEFKVSLKREREKNLMSKKIRQDSDPEKVLSMEEIDEEVIFSNITKIVKMYSKADCNGRVGY